jgi:hypothetical protein
MKSMNRTALLSIIGLLLLFVPAFAASKNQNQTTFTLEAAAKLAGIQLAGGEYALRWEGQGDNAKITVLRNDKVIGTGMGSVVDAANPVSSATLYVRPGADGSPTVVRIELPKKTLDFQATAAAAAKK